MSTLPPSSHSSLYTKLIPSFQGDPPVEDSNPYESIDAKAHGEHQELFRGDQGVESDPAHQMMDNYVSTLLPVYLARSDSDVKN